MLALGASGGSSSLPSLNNREGFNLRQPAYKTGALTAELLLQLVNKSLFSTHPANGKRPKKIEK